MVLYDMQAIAEKRIGNRDVRIMNSVTRPHELDKSLLRGITWIGSGSLSNTALAWFLKRDTIKLPGGLPITAGQAARDYLKASKLRPSRALSAQLDKVAHRQPPLVAYPGHYDDHAYIDIRAAYWSIVAIAGWNVDYHPGMWFKSGNDARDFPFPDHKYARNALVSTAMLRGSARVYWQGQYTTRNVGNQYRNTVLWAWVHDILHSIAWFAVSDCKAKYVNTDGYIMPAANIDRMIDFLTWHGLDWHMDGEGDTRIHGVGRYEVGDRKTRNPVVHDRAHFNLNPEVRDGWALDRFRRMSKIRSIR